MGWSGSFQRVAMWGDLGAFRGLMLGVGLDVGHT